MGILMDDHSTLPSTDPSTVWLTHLIEASEVLAAGSIEPCDPAIVKAFSHRLEFDVRPQFERAALGTGGLENAGLSPIS